MNLCRTLVFSALLALISAASFAAPTTREDILKAGDDPRLEQRVSFSADGLRVIDAIYQLGQQTGITLTAGTDRNDWMTYDRKVIVHVREMKLRDLMQEIASVLRFEWSREGESGKWAYALRQGEDQATEEHWLRTTTEDTKSKQEREKRESALADMASLASLSESDKAALKQTDPWRYILATESLGKDVAEFLSSYPEAQNAFVRGFGASFPVATLSPHLRDTVRRIAQSYDSLTRSIGASEDHSGLLNRFERLQITINRRSTSGSDLLSRSTLGSIAIGTSSDSLEIPLFDPASPMAKAFGAAILRLRAGTSRDEVRAYLEEALKAAADLAYQSGPSTRDTQSDQALRAKVTLLDATTPAPLPVVLKALASKTGLSVVSDYFPDIPPTMPGGERSVGEQLELIKTAYGANWEKSGNLLRLRDSEWFRKRAWEVPQLWIDYWTARGKRNSGLLLEDLAQIGNLRDEQIDHTVMSNLELVGLGAGDAARNRHILRFYWSLAEDQRTELAAKQLAVKSLKDEQWSLLQKALATKSAAYAAAERGSQTIRYAETESGDITRYRFQYDPGKGEPMIEFELTKAVAFRAQ